jgi:hypothetical protein
LHISRWECADIRIRLRALKLIWNRKPIGVPKNNVEVGRRELIDKAFGDFWRSVAARSWRGASGCKLPNESR